MQWTTAYALADSFTGVRRTSRSRPTFAGSVPGYEGLVLHHGHLEDMVEVGGAAGTTLTVRREGRFDPREAWDEAIGTITVGFVNFLCERHGYPTSTLHDVVPFEDWDEPGWQVWDAHAGGRTCTVEDVSMCFVTGETESWGWFGDAALLAEHSVGLAPLR